MKITLKEKPKSPTIIEGFPGVGLIGTITTEYLIKHLNAKPIGHIWSEEIAPVAAIHESKVVQPLEIYYSKKHNIVILHAMSDVRGLEWKISDSLEELYKLLKATEIISLEGIMSDKKEGDTYFYAAQANNTKKLGKIGLKPLKEGVIMGVTAAILLKNKTMNSTGIFVETHTKLPDSKSSAKIIENLNNYLGLGIDTKPLLAAAEQFEAKLKDYMGKVKTAQKGTEKKAVDYMG